MQIYIVKTSKWKSQNTENGKGNVFRDIELCKKDISGGVSKLSRESAYQENNWSQREPCSVNVLCQYTNGFHCLPTEQGPEVELHSCPFTTGLSTPITGSSENSCTQLPRGCQGFRQVQTGDAEVGYGSSYCWSVQDSKRRTTFKSRLKYCKIMGCSHKIIS